MKLMFVSLVDEIGNVHKMVALHAEALNDTASGL